MSRVAKWGNSPAVRIPRAALIEAGLKEGDAVIVTADGKGGLSVAPDRRRQEALEALGKFRIKIPADYKFDREEANSRGGKA
jgi:antitoxin MazE